MLTYFLILCFGLTTALLYTRLRDQKFKTEVAKQLSDQWESKFKDLEANLEVALENYSQRNRKLEKVNKTIRDLNKDLAFLNGQKSLECVQLRNENVKLLEFKNDYERNLTTLQSANQKISEENRSTQQFNKVAISQLNEMRQTVNKYEEKYGMI